MKEEKEEEEVVEEDDITTRDLKPDNPRYLDDEVIRATTMPSLSQCYSLVRGALATRSLVFHHTAGFNAFVDDDIRLIFENARDILIEVRHCKSADEAKAAFRAHKRYMLRTALARWVEEEESKDDIVPNRFDEFVNVKSKEQKERMKKMRSSKDGRELMGDRYFLIARLALHRLERPKTLSPDRQIIDMTPHLAVLLKQSYEGTLLVQFSKWLETWHWEPMLNEYKRVREPLPFHREILPMGRLLILTGSKYCHLTDPETGEMRSHAELVAMHHDPTDQGGCLIIDGKKYVIVPQETKANFRIHICVGKNEFAYAEYAGQKRVTPYKTDKICFRCDRSRCMTAQEASVMHRKKAKKGVKMKEVKQQQQAEEEEEEGDMPDLAAESDQEEEGDAKDDEHAEQKEEEEKKEAAEAIDREDEEEEEDDDDEVEEDQEADDGIGQTKTSSKANIRLLPDPNYDWTAEELRVAAWRPASVGQGLDADDQKESFGTATLKGLARHALERAQRMETIVNKHITIQPLIKTQVYISNLQVLPFIVLFKAFGIVDTEAIVQAVSLDDPPDEVACYADDVRLSCLVEGESVRTQQDALLFLGRLRPQASTQASSELEIQEQGLYFIQNCLFRHIGEGKTPEMMAEKLQHLKKMANLLVRHVAGLSDATIRESFSTRSVTSTREVLRMTFSDNFRVWIKNFTKQLRANISSALSESVVGLMEQVVFSIRELRSVRDKVKHAEANSSTKQSLFPTNRRQFYSHLRRFVNKVNRHTTEPVRRDDPSLAGLSCKLETPLGANAGLNKHLATLGTISIGMPADEAIELGKRIEEEARHLNNELHHRQQQQQQHEEDAGVRWSIMFDGTLLATKTAAPERLIAWLRREKRDPSRSIGYQQMSVAPLTCERTILVSTDRSRLLQTMWRVDPEGHPGVLVPRGIWNYWRDYQWHLLRNTCAQRHPEQHDQKKKELAAERMVWTREEQTDLDRDSAFFLRMVRTGCLETISAEEQAVEAVALSVVDVYHPTDKEHPVDQLLRGASAVNTSLAWMKAHVPQTSQRYSYCWLHPLVCGGLTLNQLPHADRNFGIRNICAAAMEKQSVAVPAFNWHMSVSTPSNILAYPQRAAVGAGPASQFACSDSLPSFQNVIAAQMEDQTGNTVEDGTRIGRISVDMLMFASIHRTVYPVITYATREDALAALQTLREEPSGAVSNTSTEIGIAVHAPPDMKVAVRAHALTATMFRVENKYASHRPMTFGLPVKQAFKDGRGRGRGRGRQQKLPTAVAARAAADEDGGGDGSEGRVVMADDLYSSALSTYLYAEHPAGGSSSSSSVVTGKQFLEMPPGPKRDTVVRDRHCDPATGMARPLSKFRPEDTALRRNSVRDGDTARPHEPHCVRDFVKAMPNTYLTKYEIVQDQDKRLHVYAVLERLRQPEDGDKQSPTDGQKGVLVELIAPGAAPTRSDGVVVNFIRTKHQMATRKTVGTVMHALQAEFAARFPDYVCVANELPVHQSAMFAAHFAHVSGTMPDRDWDAEFDGVLRELATNFDNPELGWLGYRQADRDVRQMMRMLRSKQRRPPLPLHLASKWLLSVRKTARLWSSTLTWTRRSFASRRLDDWIDDILYELEHTWRVRDDDLRSVMQIHYQARLDRYVEQHSAIARQQLDEAKRARCLAYDIVGAFANRVRRAGRCLPPMVSMAGGSREIDAIRNALLDKTAFRMYSPTTGQLMRARVMSGPMAVASLIKFADAGFKKCNHGVMLITNHQPDKSASDGSTRTGTMDHDCLVQSGAQLTRHHLQVENSDKFSHFYLCACKLGGRIAFGPMGGPVTGSPPPTEFRPVCRACNRSDQIYKVDIAFAGILASSLYTFQGVMFDFGVAPKSV